MACDHPNLDFHTETSNSAKCDFVLWELSQGQESAHASVRVVQSHWRVVVQWENVCLKPGIVIEVEIWFQNVYSSNCKKVNWDLVKRWTYIERQISKCLIPLVIWWRGELILSSRYLNVSFLCKMALVHCDGVCVGLNSVQGYFSPITETTGS